MDYLKMLLISSCVLITACHQYVDESAINTEDGMDPEVRQIMMEQEHEEPQQEEGLIPAPSEQTYWEQNNY
ncbi:MAG: hypothetical protein ABSF18_00250 [Gammaproteobacteria bacterium]|jgi:hypothetical protein